MDSELLKESPAGIFSYNEKVEISQYICSRHLRRLTSDVQTSIIRPLESIVAKPKERNQSLDLAERVLPDMETTSTPNRPFRSVRELQKSANIVNHTSR